jgi:heme/copper-type cytochrome/quinol oxidase subunit 2
LFYRGMVAAFVVGAVVQGSIIYVGWRFREGNKKNQPTQPMEGAHR